ncbi:MAG: hypothetical protein DYG97_15970, partial [Ignavibacteria bacterium CHB3]|nr:hypothetical protein [Ignavibacteria bacterium CHB3]
FLAFISLTLISLNTCDENPVNGDNIKPGRRDYVWTVDTLFMPFNSFTDITGTSPTNVWACGPGGDLDKTFYHYNGQSWNTDLIPRPISPLSVSSNSINFVWSCGLEGKIWKYCGNEWLEQYVYFANTDTLVVLQEIFAISENDIYAIGQYFVSNEDYWGLILHYNNSKWQDMTIPKIRTLFTEIGKDKVKDKLYLRGLTQQNLNENDYQLYEINGTTLNEIKSGSQNDDEFGNIFVLGSHIYFIIGYDFFKFNGNDFLKIGRLSDDPKFLHVGWGRNEKDIFLGMRDGIAHYNGDSTVYLYQTPNNVFVRAGIVFENEIFFIGRDSYGNNLMFHGKLN